MAKREKPKWIDSASWDSGNDVARKLRNLGSQINWRHPITLIIVGFVALSIFYYIFSPYQNCIRYADEPGAFGVRYSAGEIAISCVRAASW